MINVWRMLDKIFCIFTVLRFFFTPVNEVVVKNEEFAFQGIGYSTRPREERFEEIAGNKWTGG